MRGKLFALIFLAVLCIGVLSTRTDAASEGQCGTNVRWSLSDDGVLTISGTGEMWDYSFMETPWYDQRQRIHSVVIESGVRSIGSNAFSYCEKLQTVSIPNSVQWLGEYAFRECDNLYEVTLPPYVHAIGMMAFAGCDSLTQVNIPRLVQTIEEATFWECTSLGSITLPAGVKEIGGTAFVGCTALESITLPEGLRTIGTMAFSNCISLKNVSIPASVEKIAVDAFRYCPGLTAIHVDDENAWYTSDARGVLFTKDKRTLLLYPGGNHTGQYTVPDETETISPHAFAHSEYLYRVTIPEGVTTIGDDAFYSCSRMDLVKIPASVKSIGTEAFALCTSLSKIEVAKGSRYYADHSDGVLYTKDYSRLICYPNGKEDAYFAVPSAVKTIEECSFYYNKHITKVAILPGTETVKNYAFKFCENLKTAEIYNTEVKLMQNSFYGSSGSFTVYGFADSSTEEYADRFSMKFTSLDTLASCGETVYWKLDSRGKLTVYGYGAMYDWTSPDETPWHKQAARIKSVYVDYGVSRIGSCAFADLTAVTRITLVESLVHIGAGAFRGCASLTQMFIPQGVRDMAADAFRDCEKLSYFSVDGDNAMYSSVSDVLCSKDGRVLYRYPPAKKDSSFSVPDSVAVLADGAFAGANELKTLYVLNQHVTLGADLFSGRTGDPVTIGGYVGSAAEAYAAANGHPFSAIMEWRLDDTGTITITGRGEMTAWSRPEDVPWHEKRASIRRVVIEDGITTIANYAFYNCTALTEITLGNAVKSMGKWSFGNCDALRAIRVAADNPHYASDEAGALFNGDKTVLLMYPPRAEAMSYTVPDGTREIGNRAFYGCGHLTEIRLPDTVTVIGDFAFAHLTALPGITLPDGVTRIGQYAFAGCTALQTIRIPAGVEEIGRRAFHYCDALAAITADEANAMYSSDEDGVLFNEDKTSLIRYPAGNARRQYTVPDGVTIIGEAAFDGCGMEFIRLPASVREIGMGAFRQCRFLICADVYNRACVFGQGAFAAVHRDFHLHGQADSTAAAYAAQNGRSFRPYSRTAGGDGGVCSPDGEDE